MIRRAVSTVILISLMLAMFACSGGGSQGGKTDVATDTKNTPSTSVADTTADKGEETTEKQEEIMDLLEFAVTEGDFGEMFRTVSNWEGDVQKIENQSMSVKTSSSEEKIVVWKGPAAGKSFEYEAKIKVNDFAGSYVKNIFETETHKVELTIRSDKIEVGGETCAVVTDDDYHLYRFSVTEGHAIFCIDAVKKAEFDLPESQSEGLISFATKSDGSAAVDFTVKYVKVKTTEEGWTKPSDRIGEITEWDFIEDFTDATIDSLEADGWQWNSVSGATQSENGSYAVEDGALKIINTGFGEFNTRMMSGRMPQKTSKGSYTLEIRAKVEGGDANAFNFVSYLATKSRMFIQNKQAGTFVRRNDGFVSVVAPNVRDGEWHTMRFDVDFDENGNSVRVIYDGVLCGTVDGMHDNQAKNTYIDFINYSADMGEDTIVFIDYIKIAAEYK